jgi:protein SCO1
LDTVIGAHYSGRSSNLLERLVRRKISWLILCCFLFAYPIVRSVYRQLPADMPIYGTVPEFNFTDENGHHFGSDTLKGKVYIANFMFTSCQTSCPALLAKVQKVQHRLRGVMDRAAIVSITVDPDHDSSEVLHAKARELKANPYVWRFIRSTMAETEKLLVDGFKVPVGEKTYANSVMDVAHSNKFVLVDQDGRIRGYYSTEKTDIDRLMIDTGLLINKKSKS